MSRTSTWRLQFEDLLGTGGVPFTLDVEAASRAEAERKLLAHYRSNGNHFASWRDFCEQFDRHGPSLAIVGGADGGGRIIATPWDWRDPASIPLRPYIYGKQILRRTIRAKVAGPGAGKTLHTFGEALAMATGRPLLGQQVWGGAKRVWIYNLEDEMEELERIAAAACLHWRIVRSDLGGRFHLNSAIGGAKLKIATMTPQEGVTVLRPKIEEIVDQLLEHGIDYLDIDPFVASHDVPENDNGAIETIAKEWVEVAVRANCAVSLSHHISKAGGQEVTAEMARGGSSLIGAVRSAPVLNRMSSAEAKGWGIGEKERRRYFRVYDDKNNRAPPSADSDWFTIHSILLGNGGIEGGDNVGVAAPWRPPDAFEGVTSDDVYKVQLAIDAGSWKAHSAAKNWAGIAVAETMGLNLDNEKDKAAIKERLKVWIKNGALVKVDQHDPDRRETKEFIKVGKWADGPSAQG